MIRSLAAIAVAILTTQATEWFGVPLPGGPGDPHRGMERYGFALRPAFSASIAGDLGGYAPLDVPRVQAIHSGPMYHTSGDTLDTISTPGLERAARFYAFLINEIAKTSRAALQQGK